MPGCALCTWSEPLGVGGAYSTPTRPLIAREAGNRVLIRYYFDYERARIWRSEALETSRHDPSVQQPCQGCGATTWAGYIPRRVAAAQAKARANSCVAWQSCRKPARAPRAASCGADLYRSSSFCGPKEPGHDA